MTVRFTDAERLKREPLPRPVVWEMHADDVARFAAEGKTPVFVAVDGAYPTDATVTNGAYSDIVESNLNVSKSISGTKLALANALVAAAKTLTTQSPAGVYNIAGAVDSLQGTSAPKTMKGSINGLVCKKPVF